MNATRTGRLPRRGFILTVDSIIAMGFAVGLIAYLTYASASGYNVFPNSVAVQNYAEDLGNVLEQSGTLGLFVTQPSQFSNQVGSIVNGTEPGNVLSSVYVATYQYVPSGICPASCTLGGALPSANFCACNATILTFPANAPTAPANQSFAGTASRVFFVNQSGGQYYGIATVTAWVRGG